MKNLFRILMVSHFTFPHQMNSCALLATANTTKNVVTLLLHTVNPPSRLTN